MRETVYVVTSSSGSSPTAGVNGRARFVTKTHFSFITRLAGNSSPRGEPFLL